MYNLLIILAVLFAALFVILPLVEKHAKPVTAEQMQSMQKWFGILMLLMVIATAIKYIVG